MDLLATLSAPLFVHTTKSKTAKGKFILNLNNYRNAFQFKLNTSKKEYKEAMRKQIEALPFLKKIIVKFILYPGTQRKTDTPNVCSIHDKYFMDALVEFGKLTDDTYDYYIKTIYAFGHVDTTNPRVVIEIYSA